VTSILGDVTVPERILEAATRRFVRDGVMATRLEDIRRDASVSVGAVYHHFADKQALHTEAYLRALADHQAGFIETLLDSEDAESGVKAGVHYHLRWVVEKRDAAALVRGEQPAGPGVAKRLAEQNKAFYKAVVRWWRVHLAYGTVRELDPELLHALWKGAADDYCRQWLAGRNRKVPTAVARELADAAWLTLKARDDADDA
jgi:AcrR family transcriptional regulator